MNHTQRIGAALAAATIASIAGVANAGAQTTTLTGIDDYDMSTVFRPFLPGFNDRNAIIDQARWQVNGDQTGSTGTLGIFTVFDIDGSLLRPDAGAASITSLDFGIFPAVNNNTGNGGIANAGDLSIYYTTSDVDVLDPDSGIIFDNGGGTDPTGLGDQFENLTLISSAFQEEGIYDINRSADFSSIESLLLDRINSGENIRFILASQTAGFSANFGTGNVDQSDNFDFFGEPPTVTFGLTEVPTPGTAALLGLAGFASVRRRR